MAFERQPVAEQEGQRQAKNNRPFSDKIDLEIFAGQNHQGNRSSQVDPGLGLPGVTEQERTKQENPQKIKCHAQHTYQPGWPVSKKLRLGMGRQQDTVRR